MSNTPAKNPSGAIHISGISHLLLDIEGTTCPISFVAGSLYPYAERCLGPYLKKHGKEAEVAKLIKGVEQAWKRDPTPEAKALQARAANLIDYLKLLIRQDRKLTELKELQGKIWQEGYKTGDLVAPLFDDVPEALKRWHHQGLSLAGYSSGSVTAQKLIYIYSNAGNLSDLFQFWFDTRTGPKQAASSYTNIAKAMNIPTVSILFITDSLAECEAANTAGMQVLFSMRQGNSGINPGKFKHISCFSKLHIGP